jgi:aspartate kinase
MPLIVQKFGGTSVADSEKILAAARKAIRAQQQGNQVVMVVSAMGKNTDTLIELARQVNERPPARELDMLLSTGEQVSVALMAMAIDSLGYKAVSLTGAQIGIRTDSTHTKARIQSISTERMRVLLNEGNIVIAAGFQGIDENFNITTLGRGGSDTTAVALAAVLNADTCEIYTDVDGVYSTDPRILPEACLIPSVCYEEMLELASLGAGVMHSRSIEFGKKFNVPICVRSSFSDNPGSLIIKRSATEALPVSGMAVTKDEALVTLLEVPDQPGVIHQIFSPIAQRKITVDMIVQNRDENGKANISFTVPRAELADVVAATDKVLAGIGGRIGIADDKFSKISAVGVGMASQTGVASRMFQALAKAGVNLHLITTSEIKISVLVDRHLALDALRAVHSEFELEKINKLLADEPIRADGFQPVSPTDVVEMLRGKGMEGLTIDEITLDQSQSRITLTGVPNLPGIASRIFERLSKADIFIDMIVQNLLSDDLVDLSFSFSRVQFDEAMRLSSALAKELGCDKIETKKDIAKLSVYGIGLRSHTEVGITMFRALAEAGINVETINTSEVRVNVVIDSSEGPRALTCLKREFQGI